jgi:hypothetical protein
MHWKPENWMLIGVLLAAWSAAATAQVTTTQVADTIYHADGTPATGTVLLSWPAFTTASGQSIPGGSASVTIASGGALSVMLTPNSAATPIGTYYTAVFHLDDGSVSRQYWVVPVSTTPVKIAAIATSVLPLSVAMQTVSKSYVDTAIAKAVSGLSGGGGGGGGSFTPAGDLSGSGTSQTVVGIRGTSVSATAPAAGQALIYNGAVYVPQAVRKSVTLQHTFAGAGTFSYTHNLGTAYPQMTCYVNSGSAAYTANNVDANNIAITVTAASDITCTFGN